MSSVPPATSIASPSTVGRYEELDQIARGSLDDLLRAIAEVAGASRCVLGLLEAEQGWVRTVVGVPPDEAARYLPLFAYTLFEDRVIVTPDARDHEALSRVAIVKDASVRFFAGVPLRGVGGAKIGALCVIDPAPRELSESARGLVTTLARQVEATIALQRRVDDVRAKHFEHLATLQLLQGLLRAATTFAVMGCDPQGRLTVFSEGAEMLFGVRAKEVVGRSSLTVFLDPAELAARVSEVARERKVSAFEAVVAGCRRGNAAEHEWTMRRPAGTTFPASVVIAPMLAEEGAITGYVVIARDVTERKAVERIKDEFISTVSHELRTPLTAIVGALGLAVGGVGGELSETVAELVQIAHSNSHRLLRLVNDILDVQKLEAGRFELTPEACSLRAIAERAAQLIGPIAADKGIVVAVEEGDAPQVHADFERMVQVLVNLVSNAIKFSPRGAPVTIAIAHHEGRARVTVADQGPGIPEAFRPRVFGKFMQASVADSVQRGGTGLGLSIVKSIVELHGGEVGFTSEVGQGTVFHVDLPALSA